MSRRLLGRIYLLLFVILPFAAQPAFSSNYVSHSTPLLYIHPVFQETRQTLWVDALWFCSANCWYVTSELSIQGSTTRESKIQSQPNEPRGRVTWKNSWAKPKNGKQSQHDECWNLEKFKDFFFVIWCYVLTAWSCFKGTSSCSHCRR